MSNQKADRMLTNLFARYATAIDVSVADSTPRDNGDKPCFLFIGSGGDVKVDTDGGDTAVVFSNIPSGVFLPVLVTKVYTADTTASNIVACWG